VLADGGTVVNKNYIKEFYETTYRNGIVPRRAYSSNAGVKLNGISNTNFLLYSQTFTNAAWVQEGLTSIVGGAVDPDGGTTAFTITENTATSRHGFYQTVVLTAGSTNTLVFRVKAVTATFANLTINRNDTTAQWVAARFDLTNGTVVTNAATGTLFNATILTVSNGFYDLVLSGSVPSDVNVRFYLSLATDATTFTAAERGNQSYLGASRTLIVARSQGQSGTVPTDNIPTTTIAVSATQNYVQTLYDLNTT